MFKKSILTLIVISGVASFAASADSNTVTFTGRVIDESCEVNTSGSNLDVQLGDVPAANLLTLGNHSDDKEFKIVLEKCPPNENTMSISFTGTADTGDGLSDMLQLSGGSPAANTAIEIFDQTSGTKSSSPMVIDGSGKSAQAATDADGNVTFDFLADIVNNGVAKSEAGDANSSATISINYN